MIPYDQLPDDVKRHLKTKKPQTIPEQVVGLLKLKEKPLSIDEFIVYLYIEHNRKLTRKHISNILARMAVACRIQRMKSGEYGLVGRTYK